MPDPYQFYLDNISPEQDTNTVDPYQFYLNQQETKVDPYQSYLNQLDAQVDPYDFYLSGLYGGGRRELEPRETPGFFGSLASGLKRGISFGRWEDEPVDPESLTLGEKAAGIVGEMAGSLPAYIVASAVTGGVGAPIAAASKLPKVVSAFRRIGRVSSVSKKYNAQLKQLAKQGADLGMDDLYMWGKLKPIERAGAGLRGRISKEYIKTKDHLDVLARRGMVAENTIKVAQKEYIQDLVDKGSRTQAQRLSKLASKSGTGLVPFQKYGKIFGNMKMYNTVIKKAAEKWGHGGAAVVDKMFNSAATFAAVGQLYKRHPDDDTILDRVKSLPKDAFGGMLFAAAGMPTLMGKSWGPKSEPWSLMMLGGGMDYLTGSPDPNMSMEDRILHGLTLTAFHYTSHALSNVGIKDKMFKGLIDMGFDEPVAYEMAYKTKLTDDMISSAKDFHHKKGALYFNKKNPQDIISITEFKGKAKTEGEERGFITYTHLNTEETGSFGGVTLNDARKKLKKGYQKIDFKDTKLLDDLPPEVRENVDAAMEGMETDWVKMGGSPLPGGEKSTSVWQVSEVAPEKKGKDIPKLTEEQKSEKEFYGKQKKQLKHVSTKNRIFDAERDIKEIVQEDALVKGDLVQWVKDGKEQLVGAEGEYYPVKVERTDSNFAYISRKRSTAPDALWDKMLAAQEGVLPKDFKALSNLVEKIAAGETNFSTTELQLQKNYSKQIESMLKRKQMRESDISANRLLEKLTEQEYKIPLSEVQVARKTIRRPSKYKLNLRYSSNPEGKYHRTLKDIHWDDPNKLLFDSKEDAIKYAEENWVGKFESNPTIDKKLELLTSKEKAITETPEYRSFRQNEDTLNRTFKENEFDAPEQSAIIETIFPESKGKVSNMSTRQIKRVIDVIKGDESVTQEVWENRIPLDPPNFIEKVMPKWYKALKIAGRTAKETIFNISTLGDMLGGYGAEMSLMEKRHSRYRHTIVGLAVELHNGLKRDLKYTGVSMKDVNKYIQAFIDKEAFGEMQKSKGHQKFLKKMNNIVIKDETGGKASGMDAVLARYEKFYDEMAIAQISSNSYIRDASGKKLSRVPFAKIYDTRGNRVKLVDIDKDFLNHTRQVSSFLEWMKGNSKYVMNEDGGRVEVDKRLSKHHYVKDYSRRQVTGEFFDFINGSSNAFERAAAYMAKNDKQFKDLEFEVGFERAKLFMKDLQQIHGNRNVYGQQYTRIADLPAYIYVLEGKAGWGDIAPMTKDKVFKSDGTPYEVGDRIPDARGSMRTINKRIQVYDTDYINVVDKYASGLAHSTATYYAYGKGGKNINHEINRISQGLARQTGDSYYEKWAKKIMESQVYGEEQGPFSKFMRPITRWSAIAGLSFPLSGMKNLMLGQVQNTTVFTSRELLKTLGSRGLNPFGENWKNERQFAESIGSTYASSFDLYLNVGPMSGFVKRWLPNLGLMRTTEFFNRVTSQAVGPFALDTHIANMAMKKNPATRGVSIDDSRRILRDVFEYTPEQISDMIYRYREGRKAHIKIHDDNGKSYKMEFHENELLQARQQAHIVTQGSGDLPYLPYWMGKGWAKPLTLFYKVAYRITDTVAKNVIKPILVDGNVVPALKYLPLTTASGAGLYAAYDFVFDEERVNRFKDIPAQWFDYFLKAEGLALFSNAYNEYGGWSESYYPVPIRNVTTVWDNLVDYGQGKKEGSTALGDGLKEIIAIHGAGQRIVERYVAENVKRHGDSKRRQYQFLDTFYPKEQINLDYEDGITAKTPYYKALRDVFWHDDEATIAKAYYTSLAFLTHRIMSEKGVPYVIAEKEARTRLKRTVSSLKPMPRSWQKTIGRTGKTRYMEFMQSLSPEDKEKEMLIESIYRDKYRNFYNIIAKNRNLYYKRG